MSENTQEWISKLLADADRVIRIPSDIPSDDPDQLYSALVKLEPSLVEVSDQAPGAVLDLVPRLQQAGLEVIVETDLLLRGYPQS